VSLFGNESSVGACNLSGAVHVVTRRLGSMSSRIGPQIVTGQARPTPTTHASHFADVPAPLVDVALIDARQCARSAGIGLSTWYDLVKDGRAPQPAFRAVRCTRWRLADVRAFLIEFAQTGIAGGQ
jgi:predicted DNA-binding transcriptional regulator AlpA